MSARILVVDDNPLNVKLLAAKLSFDYYAVTTASDGLEALEKIEQEKPDIVLLDVMMPKLDGFETCKRIKTNPTSAHIPVVMLTALSDVSDRVKGLEAGADDFLTKPINDVALMARVRSLLRLKMIMDEWRLRETTNNQFLPLMDAQDDRAGLDGGHAVLLEDQAQDRQLLTTALAQISVRVTFAGTIKEAEDFASAPDCDLVFVSLNLKDEDGLRICPQLRTKEETRQLPILLIANENDMAMVARGLDAGATDYLMRPIDSNELIARTRTQLRQKRHYQLLRRSYERNLSLALVDPLTGAFNRRYLDAHLPRLVARSQAQQKPLSILMVDLDHFKKVNDVHGHAAGDAVLKEAVQRITLSLRPSDLVARMGGEEFAVIMPETENAFALAVAERLRARIGDEPVSVGSTALSVTVSIGVASLSVYEDDEVENLFLRADEALYKAKGSGRNRIVNEKRESL